jgi:hypothetical protein
MEDVAGRWHRLHPFTAFWLPAGGATVMNAIMRAAIQSKGGKSPAFTFHLVVW